jgi:hypothetical protein
VVTYFSGSRVFRVLVTICWGRTLYVKMERKLFLEGQEKRRREKGCTSEGWGVGENTSCILYNNHYRGEERKEGGRGERIGRKRPNFGTKKSKTAGLTTKKQVVLLILCRYWSLFEKKLSSLRGL